MSIGVLKLQNVRQSSLIFWKNPQKELEKEFIFSKFKVKFAKNELLYQHFSMILQNFKEHLF